jgi:hypothetical protein
MIKITRATYAGGHAIDLEFSDGSSGQYDLGDVIERDTELTRPLVDATYFERFFIELGALCWPNGLEFSGHAIHRRLAEKGDLRPAQRAVG